MSARKFGYGSACVGRADSRFAESASGKFACVASRPVREERVRHGGSRQQMHAFHGIDLRRCVHSVSLQRGVGNIVSITATMATDPAEVVMCTFPHEGGASSASCTACTAFGRLEHLDEHEAVRARGAHGEPPVLEVDQGRSAELPGAQAFDARRGGHESPGALHRIRGYSLLRVRTALRPQGRFFPPAPSRNSPISCPPPSPPKRRRRKSGIIWWRRASRWRGNTTTR